MEEQRKMEKVWRGLLVEKLLKALSPLLYEGVIKYPVIPSKGKLPDQRFSWEGWDYHLRKSNIKQV